MWSLGWEYQNNYRDLQNQLRSEAAPGSMSHQKYATFISTLKEIESMTREFEMKKELEERERLEQQLREQKAAQTNETNAWFEANKCLLTKNTPGNQYNFNTLSSREFGIPTVNIEGHEASSAPPMATVLGLERLSSLDRVIIKQVPTEDLDENYDILSPDGEIILKVKVTFMILKQYVSKSVQVHIIYDKTREEVISFRSGEMPSMDVYIGDERSCSVQRAKTYFKPVWLIQDTAETPHLKFKGSKRFGTNNVFFVESLRKQRIGCVNRGLRTFNTGAKDAVTLVDFPRDLDVRCKAAIIAINFLIFDKQLIKERKAKISKLVRLQKTQEKEAKKIAAVGLKSAQQNVFSSFKIFK